MHQLLTPRQIADATGASESSIKRWCDKGLITTQYTAGGHRRIPVESLLGFLRTSKHQLVNPSSVGLPTVKQADESTIDTSRGLLAKALLQGDEDQCRAIILSLFLARQRLSQICDDVIVGALNHVGTEWKCGHADIYQERYGCTIVLRLLNEMSRWSSNVDGESASLENAPVALGGSIVDDPYTLASSMIELVLRDNHWNAASLGNQLPLASMRTAISDKRPKLFWLTSRYISDEEAFVEDFNRLFEDIPSDVAVVVGGKALHEDLRRRIRYSAFCDNLQHLESFVSNLHANRSA